MLVFVALQCSPAAAFAAPAGSCAAGIRAPEPVAERRLATIGTTPVASTVPVQAGRAYLVEVEEQGNDALVEVLDPARRVIARSDHPER